MQVITTHQMSSHIAWVMIWITTQRGYHQCTPTFHLKLGYYLHMCSLPMEVGQYDMRPVSLDQDKGLFYRTIIDRNKHWWFFLKSKKGIHKQVNLPVIQLLKDMKTWWDSVYLMLECLIMLQPVSYLFHFHSWWTTLIAILYRLLIGSSKHISPSFQKSLSFQRWTGRSWKVWSCF